MTIHKSLPSDITLSPDLMERACFFIEVSCMWGTYYIAATPDVCQVLQLTRHGNTSPSKKSPRRFDQAKALRDIVSSMHLQIREGIMAGIGGEVTQALLERMDELMAPTVHLHVNSAVQRKLLENPKTETGK